jgi:hypothetical protein
MKVERRDEAEVRLVPAKLSSAQRYQSLDEGSVKESLEAALALVRSSISEQPDEIFDMFERYTDGGHVLSELSASVEEREGCEESFDERDQRDFGDEHRVYKESYIDSMERFQLGEVTENFKAHPKAIGAGDRMLELNREYTMKMKELEAKLKYEERKSKELTEMLGKAEKRRQDEILNKGNKINALQVKMTLQDRTFCKRLESEEQRRKILKDKLEAIEDSSLEDREASRSGESEKIHELKQKVRNLELEVADQNVKRAALESSLEARQITFDYYITTANSKIKEKERRGGENEKMLQNEKAHSKKLELEVAKAEAILELDRKKVKTLELSETRTNMLLAAERKRAEALENLNERMKTAMRRLTRKALVNDSAHVQIANLTKELEKRDAVISRIRTILGGNLETLSLELDGFETHPIHARDKKSFLRPRVAKEYSTQNYEQDYAPFQNTHSDTSS